MNMVVHEPTIKKTTNPNLLFDMDTPYKDFIRKCNGVFPFDFEKQ